MIDTGKLVDDVYMRLKAHPVSGKLNIVMAYENEIKPTPIIKPICALSLKNVQVSDKLTETTQTGEIWVTEKRRVTMTLSTDIYLPYSMGGNAGYKLYDELANFFIYLTNKYVVKSSYCDNIYYDKSCQALILRNNFVIEDIADEPIN